MIAGCITRRWSQTLLVPNSVIRLIERHPEFMPRFERLHDLHGRRMPATLDWGRTVITNVQLDARHIATILTRCDRKHGLTSRCWADLVTTRRR